MLDYLARRLLGAIGTLVAVIVVVFFATRLSGNAMDYLLPPGIDAHDQAGMIDHFGLDQPLWVQFSRFIGGPLQGDAGISLFERRPVTAIYAERLPNTIALFAYALALAVALGVPLGIAAALKRKTIVGCGDHVRRLCRICDAELRPRHRHDPDLLVQPALASQLRVDASPIHFCDAVDCSRRADAGRDHPLHPKCHAGRSRARTICAPRGPRACRRAW